MPEINEDEIKDIISKYQDKIKTGLGEPPKLEGQGKVKARASREFNEFKKQYMPRHLSLYEKACNWCEKTIKLKPDKKKAEKLQDAIDTCHLNITPSGVVSFAMLLPISIALIGGMISFVLLQSMFFLVFFLIVGVSMLGPLGKLPLNFALSWKQKASNQMVLCCFYTVTYMRHTSNLELAIEFAAEHLAPPLSLDLRKVLWNVETEKYESIRESLDMYLEGWRDDNMEFIQSFHLIESSLYEGSEDRRLTMLDKSLEVMLSETYEKMLHYAQNLQGPITMVHMLGVILPVLGLVILPLVVSFMPSVGWYHIAALYNVALPLGVYFLGASILSKRPSGGGSTTVSEDDPNVKKFTKMQFNILGTKFYADPKWVSIIVAAIFIFIGFSPLLLHLVNFPDTGFFCDTQGACKFDLLDYQEADGKLKGPYGLGASVLSIFVVLGIALGFGLYYKLRSRNVIELRNRSKQLETEFASALFQLGNRLGDGLPAEMAFGKVAQSMQNTTSGQFFETVSHNIRRLGMSVEEAIFNPTNGALKQFPSDLIESSMKVLTESVKKGPMVAAQALMNISQYLKEMRKVNDRLTDLLAEILSSMRSQIKFLTPVIAGIVIGITSMVTTIIGKLVIQMKEGMGGGSSFTQMFHLGLPTYYFQIVVGIYVVQIIAILTITSNTIENGTDITNRNFLLGNNLTRGVGLYCILSLVIMVLFNMIAATIISATG